MLYNTVNSLPEDSGDKEPAQESSEGNNDNVFH